MTVVVGNVVVWCGVVRGLGCSHFWVFGLRLLLVTVLHCATGLLCEGENAGESVGELLID